METKLFEVRDRATYIPVMATKLTSYESREKHLLWSTGFTPGNDLVLIAPLTNLSKAHYSAYEWGDEERTFTTAHTFIQKNFDELPTGSVIDVEFLLGETDKPKEAQ